MPPLVSTKTSPLLLSVTKRFRGTSSSILSNVRSFHTSKAAAATGTVDTLIVGGGPIGSSTAYHLAMGHHQEGRSDPTIWVIEKDPTYRSASATVSACGIRQQFSLKENVQMSAYGRDFLRQAEKLLRVDGAQEPPNMEFKEKGYLFLASTPNQVQQLKRNHQIQMEANENVDVDLLDVEQLNAEFPWLNTEDILLGSFGRSGEGWFDPWAYLVALKAKNCRDLGVVYKHATPISAKRNSTTGEIEAVLLQNFQTQETEWVEVGQVVNAAGAYAQQALDTLSPGLESPFPVRPRKRSIFFFHCQPSEGTIIPPVAPLTVDPLTGVYFRSEGAAHGNFLAGVSPPADQDFDCLDPQQELRHADFQLWDEIIWPALYHRIPAFGCIKLLTSWAGLYEYNTVDQNAIIDFHPEVPNLLMVNGFSGHGLQHSPAAGRAASELLQFKEFRELDLEAFRYDRILEGTAVLEQGIY